jgi:TatA/E family protein of Tat protein translocase
VFGVSPTEMLMLMLVALLLFGGDLPKVARSWGKSLAEFKRSISGIQNEFHDIFREEPRQIPYHDPVYSHNAGTIDADTVEADSVDNLVEEQLAADATDSVEEPKPFRESSREQTSSEAPSATEQS